MAWPAIIIGIIIIYLWWDRKQDDLYPPGMREKMRLEAAEKRAEDRQKKQRIVRMKKAMNDPKYYEEMKHFDPNFTVPSGTWNKTPEGKEEVSKKLFWMMVSVFLFLIVYRIMGGAPP